MDGFEKLAFKGHLKYIDFQVRNMGAKLHPENYKILKEAEFLMENNMPIPRMHLYIVMPEIFKIEVDDIEEIKAKKLEMNKIILGYVP